MRHFGLLATFAIFAAALNPSLLAQSPTATNDESVLAKIYDTALGSRSAYAQLIELTAKHPGRLSGSKNLEGAVLWGADALKSAGADRVELQPVMVPHWERGAPESVRMFPSTGAPADSISLAALALGGSIATPPSGLRGRLVELQSIDELKTVDVRGKIVFFNRPMTAGRVSPGVAYGETGDQRNRGPAEAAKAGAIGTLVRSLTHALDDIPHTGNTSSPKDGPRIPAAAISTLAAERLSAALKTTPDLEVEMAIHSQWFPDAPSHNVIGEIRGSEHPEQIILVGGHLDSWDVTPGAQDNGTGVVASIEVFRLLKAIGYQPRHTIRCVLFTSEENSGNGGREYARVAAEKNEKHILALENDAGGDRPRGFNFGNATGDAHIKAARWKELLMPYGIHLFQRGMGGADVRFLFLQGQTVAGLMPESQRYFDYHHTTADTPDKVNPRELALGAAAMASLVYLVDQHGL